MSREKVVERAEDVRKWLLATVKELVEKSTLVAVEYHIKYDEDEGAPGRSTAPFVTYEVKVADSDVGLVIGERGQTVSLLKQLVLKIGWKEPKIKTRIEITDPHPERRTMRVGS
jgi:predicted RNA-binding protein YlqC (UPF0109 family)